MEEVLNIYRIILKCAGDVFALTFEEKSLSAAIERTREITHGSGSYLDLNDLVTIIEVKKEKENYWLLRNLLDSDYQGIFLGFVFERIGDYSILSGKK